MTFTEVYDGHMTAGYRSIFTPATRRERATNFESYWAYSVEHDGEILEDQKSLGKKHQILTRFQSNPVRACNPLPDPERFYRNYVKMQDDPLWIDVTVLMKAGTAGIGAYVTQLTANPTLAADVGLFMAKRAGRNQVVAV